jgi:hypothetical protein
MENDISHETIIDNCKRTCATLNRISGYPAFVHNSTDEITNLFFGPPKNVYMALPKSAVPDNEGLPFNCLGIIRQFVIDNGLKGHVGFTPIIHDRGQITLPRLAFASMTPQADLDRIAVPFTNMMQKILLIATPVSVLENLLRAWEVRWQKGSFDPADKAKLVEAMYYARKPFGRSEKGPFAATGEMLDALIEAERSVIPGIRKSAGEHLENLRNLVPALGVPIDEKRQVTCTRENPPHSPKLDRLDS